MLPWILVLLMSIGAVWGQNAPDNKGTQFIFAFMDNYLDSFSLELFVTTSRTTPVNVIVTSPKWTSPSVNEQFSVVAGTVKQIFIDVKLRLEGTVKESKGIRVKGDDEIVVYGVNKQTHSNDAFLGLPTDVLGTDYYTVTYYPPYRKAQICVVGIQDTTTVKIKLGSCGNCGSVSYGGKTYSKGQTLTVTLNRFDAIQLQSTGDLSGCYISSDKPVSAFSGNMKTNTGSGSSQDHLVEQLIPVDTWGKRFATVPTPTRTIGDYYKIISSEDDTKFTYKCDRAGLFKITDSFTIAWAGNYRQISISSDYFCYFTADKPIMLTFIVKSQVSSSEPADPAMIIIPPIEQYAADYTFTTPKYSGGSYTNYFMFVVKKADKDGLLLDGKAFPANTLYNNIPDTDFVGGYTLVSDGSHTVRHKSPISIFGGFLYGMANLESYGFTTGMRMARINAPCIPSATVVGDGLDNDCDGKIDEELCTPENQGKDDDGDGVAEEDCAQPAPVDGNWSNWASWATCSVTCTSSGSSASGSTSRTRTCTNPAPKYDGKQCVGSSSETGTCSTTSSCPVNGNWATWGSWGACSVSCGSGQQSRTRGCSNPAPAYGGTTCSGTGTETMSCTMPACPVDGSWGQWLSWGSCSVTCATGTQTRSRPCDNPAPANGGSSCSGSTTETMQCTQVACPVDGSWASWGTWGSCSVTCASGIQSRSRTCSNPAPAHNGANCVGDTTSTQACTMVACPVDGNWGAWASWGTCSVTCASGTQERQRSCNNPAPAHNGAACVGSTTETQTCTQVPCPIDGNWGTWASWGTCSVTCASGTQERQRSCDSPAPAHNGAACVGSTTSTQACTQVSCPVDGNWAVWGSWGSCSVTCATGTQDRSRTCTDPAPAHNGANCAGSTSSTQSCTMVHCPIDGSWGSWASWGTCSVSCGGGQHQRTRSCDNPTPLHNGAACPGANQETQNCNTQSCVIDGSWGAWEAWGACSISCGGGKKMRMRTCDDPRPTNGGLPCSGVSSESSDCSTQSCPTASPGSYVQKCPTGFFTCQRGAVSCIDEAFRCDCEGDCDDDSDESVSYGSCDPLVLVQCKSGAPRLTEISMMTTGFLAVISAVFLIIR